MNIAVQAWGKPVTVPLAWMTLKLVVIAPAMNVLIATVLIVKRLGVLTLAQVKITALWHIAVNVVTKIV